MSVQVNNDSASPFATFLGLQRDYQRSPFEPLARALEKASGKANRRFPSGPIQRDFSALTRPDEHAILCEWFDCESRHFSFEGNCGTTYSGRLHLDRRRHTRTHFDYCRGRLVIAEIDRGPRRHKTRFRACTTKRPDLEVGPESSR